MQLPVPLALALALTVALVAASARAEDLAKRYPGALTHVDQGLPTRCGPEDVWQLKSFEIAGKDFLIAGGKANLAVGVNDGNALWVVVFPDQPVKIASKGQPGDGESTSAICLRFQPGELGQRFPAKTVGSNGDPWMRARAEQIFRRKVGPKWATKAGFPTIVPGGIMLVDVDTRAAGKSDAPLVGRRYEIDRNNAKVTYVADFESQPVPSGTSLAKKDAEKIYDDVWDAFDREYANFTLLPKLDWKKLGAERRKLLARADTSFDVAAVLADLLASLEDLHVWVKCGEDHLPGYAPERPLNASWKGSEKLLGGVTDTHHDIVWSRTSDGIGYVNVTKLEDREKLVLTFDEVLEKLADTWSLVVDLRFNGGGQEDLGAGVASRFVDQERVYSKNQYRNGPRHDQLGPVLERRFAPRGPWRYESPVVVLQGRRVMSSAESLALMLAQCPQVTTMGDRTAGSSGAPRPLEPGAGITINQPRWHDMDPAGKPIEHAGIEPEVKLDFPSSAFTDAADPVLAAALEQLRKPVAGGRKPGKR